jgi:hypothetical protein
VSNPYFTIRDLDCWPCEGVRQVIDLTGVANFTYKSEYAGIPFVVKVSHSRILQFMSQLETMECVFA